MLGWRITKYNPQYRDDRGAYLKSEWTCYSDIGKTFEGKTFTLTEYLKIEDAYIQGVILFMECLNLDSLRISCLEKNGRRPKKFIADNKLEIVNNSYVNKENIIHIIQLILRNEIWCKLKTKAMYVHFGYDFYMYIGSIKPCDSIIKKIELSGLFVEKHPSPYVTNS